MSDVSADFSDLGKLETLLKSAGRKTAQERTVILGTVAERVRSAAAATAASYPHATGNLAGDVVVTGSALTKRIGSNVKEGHFLEFGSPTTGGPRPWLTGPAEVGTQELVEALAKAAALW